MNKVYIVTMYRWGEREAHSYVLGGYSNPDKAIEYGLTEESDRGRKYTCEVLEIEIDNISIDYRPKVILRLERNNPLDINFISNTK